MTLTFIGAIQAIIAAGLLLFGSLPAMFAFVLASGLFGGSAALTLPALGGSTIPPIQFALVFMVLRMMLPGAGQMPRVGDAVRANWLLFVFVVYGVIIAYLGPRIFADQIDVTPLRGRVEARYVNTYAFIYSTRPLVPSTQNITTSIYLVGTLLLCVASYVAAAQAKGRELLVKAAAIIALVHVVFGVLSVALRFTPAEAILDAMRNGAYAQLTQSYKGFFRITGLFPEPSSYANYAFVYFVFLFECWFRGVQPRLTGFAALCLALVLVFGTATTAYAGLGIYGALFALRCLIFPSSVRLDKLLVMLASGLFLVIATLAAMVLNPDFITAFVDLIQHMTVEKADSLSGTQRTFWAKQGIDAFLFTNGIGIGPGSFRSSSLTTAIMGSMGIIGIASFVLFVLNVLKPLRASTYFPSEDRSWAIGSAASWAVLALTMVASLSYPSCDPGPEFAVFAGAALACRARRWAGSGEKPLLLAQPLIAEPMRVPRLQVS